MKDTALSDNKLVQLAQTGNFDAFEQLVSKHSGKLYSIAMNITANPEDAEDIVQGAFLKAMEHIETFRGDAAFSTWVSRIAINDALKLVKTKASRPSVSMEKQIETETGTIRRPDFIADWGENPEKKVERMELNTILREAIEELPQKYRIVFVCRDIQGLSTEETAERLELRKANVKVRLLRARLMLREKLSVAFGQDSPRLHPEHDHDHPDEVEASEVLKSYLDEFGEYPQ